MWGAKGLPEPGVSGVGPLPYQTPEGVGPPLFRGGPVAPEGAPALDRNCRNGYCEHHSSHACTAVNRRSQAFALSAVTTSPVSAAAHAGVTVVKWPVWISDGQMTWHVRWDE